MLRIYQSSTHQDSTTRIKEWRYLYII